MKQRIEDHQTRLTSAKIRLREVEEEKIRLEKSGAAPDDVKNKEATAAHFRTFITDLENVIQAMS